MSELVTSMGQTTSDSSQLPLEVTDDAEDDCSVQDSSSSRLAWDFIDLSKAETCPIFEVDPVMLKKFIGHQVTVVTKSKQEFNGCCLTIDPVTLSVILARRIEGGRIRVVTLPGYNLSRIYTSPASVPPEERVSVNDMDVAELYHASSLYTDKKAIPKQEEKAEGNGGGVENDKQGTPCVVLAEDLGKRKEALISWLKKHHMPVTVKGDDLELIGGVKIIPPYLPENCDTKGNQIIKKKLSELIKSLPASESQSQA